MEKGHPDGKDRKRREIFHSISKNQRAASVISMLELEKQRIDERMLENVVFWTKASREATKHFWNLARTSFLQSRLQTPEARPIRNW